VKFRSAGLLLLAAILRPAGLSAESDPPRPASFRSALEAQFPRRGASGAALALEELTASFGLGLAPKQPEADATPTEGGTPSVRKDDGRARPTPEAGRAFEPIGSAAAQFVDREVKTSQEQVAAPPPPVERFLADHDGEMAAIQSLLLREDDVRWEIDVSKGAAPPLPYLLGFLRLQKLLLSRALTEIRGGRPEEALQTLEASWRFNEAVRARPEVISHLIHIAVAKLQVGVLRKVDAAPVGWPDRLRDARVLADYVVAFENEFWFMQPDAQDLTGKTGALGRVLRRIGEEFQKKSPCEWSPAALHALVKESNEGEIAAEELERSAAIVPNLVDGFLRARRYEIDAELTALVIDARLERDASRRRRWPEKLVSAGQGVLSRTEMVLPPASKRDRLAFVRRKDRGKRFAGPAVALRVRCGQAQPAFPASAAKQGAAFLSS
jgi:hypothetical protein